MKELSPQAQQDPELVAMVHDLERVMDSIGNNPSETIIGMVNQLDMKGLSKMMMLVGHKNIEYFYKTVSNLAFRVHSNTLNRKSEDATTIAGGFHKLLRLAYYARYMDEEGKIKHTTCMNDLSIIFHRLGVAAASAAQAAA